MERFVATLPLAAVGMVLVLGLVGCDMLESAKDATSPVGITFETESPTRTGKTYDGDAPDSLVVEGTNGTLVLKDIRLIVAKIELTNPGATCPDSLSDEGDCAAFETNIQLVDLPLDTSAYPLASQQDIPTGTYSELTFEVADLTLDDNGENTSVTSARIDSLRNAIQTAGYDSWPTDASMGVSGYFTGSDNDSPVDFTAYIDADLDVELELDPPLAVTGGQPTRSILVRLRPGTWFMQPNGSVRDLSTTTNAAIELARDFEDGVAEAKIEARN